MRYIRAISGFKGMKDAELLKRALAILEAIGNNIALFAEPAPPIADVQAATDDYRNKLVASSQTKGLPDISLKNEAKEKLADILQQLAFYVNTTANGHLPTLYASGFEVTSPRITGLYPGTPERLRTTDGQVRGTARFDFDRVAGAGMVYDYCYGVTSTEDETPEWSEPKYTRSSRNNVIADLPRQQVVHIRVRAVNTTGIGDWCDAVSHIIR